MVGRKRVLEDRNCMLCKEKFRPKNNKRIFCSKSCASIVSNTGKILSEYTKGKISESKNGNCLVNSGCFKKGCKPHNYVDGRSLFLSPARYGDDWKRIRNMVYLRDKFACQNCGVTHKQLDVHHKVPFLVSHDNSLENLISLCRKCHMMIERKLVGGK